jgi:hypothetical protein
MAELDGLERIAAFTKDIMGGNIAVPALPVENVEHLSGHRAIHLDQAQDVSESGPMIDRHAGTLGDPYRKALRELSGLEHHVQRKGAMAATGKTTERQYARPRAQPATGCATANVPTADHNPARTLGTLGTGDMAQCAVMMRKLVPTRCTNRAGSFGNFFEFSELYSTMLWRRGRDWGRTFSGPRGRLGRT